jgi:hypothetical protein
MERERFAASVPDFPTSLANAGKMPALLELAGKMPAPLEAGASGSSRNRYVLQSLPENVYKDHT